MSIRLDGHAMPCETGCLHIACRCAVISAQTFACLKTNLGSVSQPDHMPSPSIDLSAMNKQTIRFSSFAGRLTNVHSYSYTYNAKRSGTPITAHKLEARLVGDTETKYTMAVFKGSAAEVSAAKLKYMDSSLWVFSNIKFDESASVAFLSSPLPWCVDLKKTNVAINEDTDIGGKVVQVPVPPRTVAETCQITSTRHQDLLGLVTNVEPPRQTKRGEVADVTVMDGSENGSDYAQVKIAVWGHAKQQLVKDNLGKPLVFFNLVCKVGEGSKQYTSWDDSPILEAPTCDRTTKLNEDAESLLGAKNVTMLTNYTAKASVDVSGPQTLAASALLAYTSRNPNAKLPNVLQLMSVMIEEPVGAVTVDGTERIWFITKLREFSGVIDVSIAERVALKLTGLDRVTFVAAHEDGSLQFPLLCNARISRSIAASAPGQIQDTQCGASQSTTSVKSFVNHTLQDVEPLDWSRQTAPNAAYECVLSILNALPKNEEGLLFGFLADIQPDAYAGFRLVFPDGSISKGCAVAVLVASQKKNNKPEPLGDGFKVCAPDVKDIANSSAETSITYVLTGFCTLDDMAKFELTPPRGQQQRFAIALITNCVQNDNDKILSLDKLQLLEAADGDKAVHVSTFSFVSSTICRCR